MGVGRGLGDPGFQGERAGSQRHGVPRGVLGGGGSACRGYSVPDSQPGSGGSR